MGIGRDYPNYRPDWRDRLYRGTGRTTRLVDAAVQTFFRKGEVEFMDHRISTRADEHGFKILIRRLINEHGILLTDLEIDRRNWTVKWKEFIPKVERRKRYRHRSRGKDNRNCDWGKVGAKFPYRRIDKLR